MFRSARLKLTLFYLATLLVFSLTLTGGIRLFADYEFKQSIMAQRGEFHSLARNGLGLLVPNPERTFTNTQDRQTALASQHLNQRLIILNLGALVVGGLVSWWFAGRTLRPIANAHAAQARFVADASHELRTPLANIRAENEVFLRQKTFDEADTRELVKSNLEEVQRLENLSRDLLALTQYGQSELPLAAVPVESVVNDALEQTAALMKDRDIKIRQQLAKATVHGHQESLVRLLVILFDNAVKYGPAKGTIYIAGAQHGNHYVLTVRDEGQGIAPHDLPRIFDRLYRGDTARARGAGAETSAAGGYGLGLSLAREIVQANHGSIKAYNYNESQGGDRKTATNDGKNNGAVFSIQLPVMRT